MRKAVFIDRDGTLIKDVPYNADPALISFEYHAAEMLRVLKQKDFLLIIISNQSGIARGFFSEHDVHAMHKEIQKMLLQYDVRIDAFYYCPHLKDGEIKEYAFDCDCRKPKPGLIYRAAHDFNINLKKSWMIGDILNDAEAGNAAGCKTILITNGNETEWILNDERLPTFTAGSLKEATEIILKHELEPV